MDMPQPASSTLQRQKLIRLFGMARNRKTLEMSGVSRFDHPVCIQLHQVLHPSQDVRDVVPIIVVQKLGCELLLPGLLLKSE